MTSDTLSCPAQALESPLVSRIARGGEASTLVDAIGSRTFSNTLFKSLQMRTAAEHLTLYRFDKHGFDICGAASDDGSNNALTQCRRYVDAGYWRKDPAIAQAGLLSDLRVPVFFRVTAEHIADADYKKEMYQDHHITERLVICADRPNGRFGLSLVRTAAVGSRFTDPELHDLADVANVALSAVAKHALVGSSDPPRLITSFSSVAEIEARLGASTLELSMRERQVCARILFGLSVHGISLDLGIGEESVATYRKRAYRRLNIGSRHELLRFYMAETEPGNDRKYHPLDEDDIGLSLNKGTDACCILS